MLTLSNISLLVLILTCNVIRTAGLRGAVGGVGVTLGGGRLGEGGGRGGGEGGAGQWREGVWVGGVLGHQRLVVQGGVPELCQQAVLGVELAVARDQNRRQH